MPYLTSSSMRYEEGKYLLWNICDLTEKFPFLQDKVVIGELVSAYIDGKITKVREGFKCKIIKSENYIHGVVLDPNPLKKRGVPPCDVLIIFYKYEDDEKVEELPIMEGVLLKSSYLSSHFEDEVKRLIKEEEIRITLESVVFHPSISPLATDLRDAYFSFEQENFSFTKTACRKIMEKLRNFVAHWKTIDGSESICDKFKQIMNSIYSFSSIGGPHEGVVTGEETELILKLVHAILIYVNSILKNERFTTKRA